MPWYRLARLLASLTLLPLCTSFTLDRAGGDTPTVAEPTTPYRVSRRYAAGLEYLLIEPREVSADDELPMLVYLHGRASTPEAPRRRFFDIEIPVRIIMPRAPDRYGRGYSWMPVSAASGESPELTRALVARARMIAEATRVWRDRHPTRGLPIVVGFSQGGLLSMELAMHHPGAVAEAISVNEFIPATIAFAPAEFPVSSSLGSRRIHAGFGALVLLDPCVEAIRPGNA